jgi:hypothetical protein
MSFSLFTPFRVYEGRYFTLMSGSHLMTETVLSKEIEMVIFITNNTLRKYLNNFN